jgi:hypothetical protein
MLYGNYYYFYPSLWIRRFFMAPLKNGELKLEKY